MRTDVVWNQIGSQTFSGWGWGKTRPLAPVTIVRNVLRRIKCFQGLQLSKQVILSSLALMTRFHCCADKRDLWRARG